ncbi:MAG: hypothetical protein ABSA11_13390 [Candidatus Bathyarchaeia archaeon]
MCFSIYALCCVCAQAKYLKICRGFIGTSDPSDVAHAATCLQTGSTLISDDRHFDKIRDEEIVDVWGTERAFDELLGP